MSKRPKRSRAEQRTPTVERIEGPRIEMGPDYYVGPKDAVIVADPPAPADPPRGGRIVELGAPFDEELPALSAEVLAAAGLIAHVDAPEGGLKAGDTVAASIVPLPAWWPEDAGQQATLVEALDSWDLGYNEVGGIAWREQLVVVTRGGLKLHWPADRGRQISDMHKGRPHEHAGPGRQFPAGYLRRDASRDPKE